MKTILTIIFLIQFGIIRGQNFMNDTSPKVDSLFNSRLTFLNQLITLRDSLDQNQINDKEIFKSLENRFPIEEEYKIINFFERISGIHAPDLFVAGAKGKEVDRTLLHKWQKWVDQNKHTYYINNNDGTICKKSSCECFKI